jgi:hypothetical protein
MEPPRDDAPRDPSEGATERKPSADRTMISSLPNFPTEARLPIPGNAEFALWLAVELLFAIIWITSDAVDAGAFVTMTGVITFAYLISRGIAKASRVLEQ